MTNAGIGFCVSQDSARRFVLVDMAERSLTLKQERFIAAYLGDAHGNATEAARIAGYTNPIISAKDNMRNHAVRARVAEHVAKFSISADQVLEELADVGFADWRDFIEVIQRDREGNPVRVRMDLSNKVKALELLGKYHQLFVERQQVDVNIRDHRIGVPQSTIDRLFRPAETTDDERMNA
jgi:phage terminase small subunit